MSDREQEVRRAREVLNGAGWVFDNFINSEMGKLMKTGSGEGAQREVHYMRVRVATELKAQLLAVVESWDFETKQAESRQKKEK